MKELRFHLFCLTFHSKNLRDRSPCLPVIITHTSLPLKYVKWPTYESLCCLRGVNDKGDKKAWAPTVPMLCIPADTWHRTFDSSLHTLIKLTGGDEEKEDDKCPSRERMSQQMTETFAPLCRRQIRLSCILKSVFMHVSL